MLYRMQRFHTAAVAFVLAISPVAGAKPPDLPAASREAVAPPVEQIPVMPTETKATGPSAQNADARVSGARRLYLIAERCRREGDLDMAINCYHEVDLLSPHSAYGRKARRRLHDIEAQRPAQPAETGAEEQEVPRPMPERLQINVIEAGTTIFPTIKNQGQKIPVLSVPLPPRNLTIYVEGPDTY